MVKNLPANAGDTGSIPGPGRSYMPRNNQAYVPPLLSLRSRAWELRLVSPHTATTKVQVPWSPWSATREALAHCN